MKEVKREHFVVYKTFVDTIENAEKAGIEYAYEVAKAILQYGIYGEYDSNNPMVMAVMPGIQVSIDNAETRYKEAQDNGKKGGRPTKVDKDQVLALKQQGLTHVQIAKEVGCCERHVGRIISDERKRLEKERELEEAKKEQEKAIVREFNF